MFDREQVNINLFLQGAFSTIDNDGKFLTASRWSRRGPRIGKIHWLNEFSVMFEMISHFKLGPRGRSCSRIKLFELKIFREIKKLAKHIEAALDLGGQVQITIILIGRVWGFQNGV